MLEYDLSNEISYSEVGRVVGWLTDLGLATVVEAALIEGYLNC